MKDNDKRAFLTALEVARRGDVPLHVAALPPGQVDLGDTTFDHCPRCKAGPPLDDHAIREEEIL
jgi:hypothetical protein